MRDRLVLACLMLATCVAQAQVPAPECVLATLVETPGAPFEVVNAHVPTIARGQPIICGTDWDVSGGHWVVVDTVNNFFGTLYASVNDPWDADVHITPITRGTTVRYSADKAKTSWDAGGLRHEYAAKPSGVTRVCSAARGGEETWAA